MYKIIMSHSFECWSIVGCKLKIIIMQHCATKISLVIFCIIVLYVCILFHMFKNITSSHMMGRLTGRLTSLTGRLTMVKKGPSISPILKGQSILSMNQQQFHSFLPAAC
jgi:hypothetical protein